MSATRFWLGLGMAVLAAGPLSAAGSVAETPAVPDSAATAAADAVEKAFQALIADDDAAQAEVDRWIQETKTDDSQGPDLSGITLKARIEQRLEPVRRAYERFVQRHPDHVRARLAFGSFLNDISLDDEALVQWKKARDLDPNNPAAWNNLADYYSRHGPTRLAFECLDEAIRIKPSEAVYQRNLATLVFLYRNEARIHYRLADEQQVLRRTLELYQKARRFDPNNFQLATDLAQVYYYLKPEKVENPARLKAAGDKLTDEALRAWLEARALARTDLDREGVAVHLARVCLRAGRLDQARQYLGEIKNSSLAAGKEALEQTLQKLEKGEPVPLSEL
ncbi:MAG: hypothetical protein KA191_08680 [Verrucomicrobia bacterium]|nr:hypothetical protein [Verrucomicrobiota bacterium]MDI9382342.1 hypothetical protein [Verrucomicrobiota bacterium]NMD20922.1 hypothetical protein [Verrucomicrobiota bacterium]HNU98794.1 hypothetical protein [Verrucomicrobiota bacterium]HOA60339.1 hypothetical protein [Verrucomicrobiota bacterium]